MHPPSLFVIQAYDGEGSTWRDWIAHRSPTANSALDRSFSSIILTFLFLIFIGRPRFPSSGKRHRRVPPQVHSTPHKIGGPPPPGGGLHRIPPKTVVSVHTPHHLSSTLLPPHFLPLRPPPGASGFSLYSPSFTHRARYLTSQMSHLRSTTAPPSPAAALLCPKHPFRVREFRVYKRRKLKPARRLHLPLRAQLSDFHLPFDDLLHGLVSLFSPDVLLPGAFGFASGAGFYLARRKAGRSERHRRCSDVGEWILFSSPTPFNRFVLLRCPSISFEGSELLEDVNEKLVKEDRHFVRLDSGRMQVREGDGELREKLEYQRVCVGTTDGGVISIDWPANLDLREEHGLDSTLLLVPGTAEGSMDENVRAFVCDALRHGFFPVVMNPRGCAGSPLTTAR